MSLRLIAVTMLLAGCGSVGVPQEVRAVRDFVVVADLEPVDIIRLYRQLRYDYVNDYFVTVSIGDRHYLVEFDSRCRALRARTYTAAMVDFRYDPSYLRVNDTIRGCPVGRIFKATEEQLEEISGLSHPQASGTVVPAKT